MRNYSQEEILNIFQLADKERAISRFLQDELYKKAEEMNFFCTWLIEHRQNEQNGFSFKVEVETEDKTHKISKNFVVGMDWENEKGIMKTIILFLLNGLQDKVSKQSNEQV